MFLAIDALVLGLRALTFVALFQAAGTAMFLALYERELLPATGARIRNVARIAAVVALCAAVLHYVLTPARMAGTFDSAFDPSLESLLLRSNSGSAHIVRVVGLALLVLSLDRANRLNTIMAGIGAALAVGSFVLMGHTAIHAQRLVLAPLLLVHVGVAAFWFGSLWPLRMAVGAESADRCGALVAQFSKLAVWLVPAILVCGALIAVVFVRSWAELATGYGAMVLAKAGAFAALMGLAALNKRRFGPALRGGGPQAAARFRRTVDAEWALIAAVLVATAVMTSLYSPEHLEGAFAPEHRVQPSH